MKIKNPMPRGGGTGFYCAASKVLQILLHASLAAWREGKRPRRFSKSRPDWGRPHPPTSWGGVLCISIVTAQTSVGV